MKTPKYLLVVITSVISSCENLSNRNILFYLCQKCYSTTAELIRSSVRCLWRYSLQTPLCVPRSFCNLFGNPFNFSNLNSVSRKNVLICPR
ncbi:hypothetical protein PUN28_010963 [Cardiocondyla obscurior]|uniref:Secreted protein n=1 Tax=Cardiocondyla obscurior TaxID=286306 RepID=A0AAW2FN19_9HYME